MRFAILNPTAETFLHLLDLRMVLEFETASRLARQRPPEAIAELRAILSRAKTNRRNLPMFAEMDYEFHLAIARASGNPLFESILAPLKQVGREFGLVTYRSSKHVMRVLREHAAILNAIEAGDPKRARRLIRDHIHFSRDNYLAMLSQEPG